MGIIEKIWKMIKEYKVLEFAGVLLTFIYTLSVYLVPLVSEYLIDEVIPSSSKRKMLYGVVIFAVVCCLQPIFGYFKDRLFNVITENVTYDIRKKLFNSFLYSDFNFLNKVKGGDLISIIMNDGRGASDFITNIFSVLLKNIFMILMIVVGMMLISYKITLIVICLFVILLLLNYMFGNKIQKASENIQLNYDEICTCVNQTNNSIVAIKAFGREKVIEQKFENIIKKMKKDNISIDSISILLNNLTSAVIYICLSVIYGWGALNVIDGKLQVGQVIALGLYFQLLEQPFFELMNTGVSFNIIIPIMNRIEVYQKVRKEELGEKEDIIFDKISIHNLSFKYEDNDQIIFDNVNLELPAKGLINIVGESGTGKTTFIKMLLGMVKIRNNCIFIGKYDISDLSLATLRGCISYVPQELILDNDTFINNIKYGNEQISDYEVINICKKLHLHNKISALPDKYNNIISERVDLSGGEKQRILIARALLQNKKILIMDEPNSALDIESSKIINEIISNVAKDILVILIAHHNLSEMNVDMKLQFGKGKIINLKE
ncbi:MAG: ABC transporter ATP-binding protein [Eubacterium sp.]|nr:ABC transporter ATP-binding protein [Eubacterium sp.]